MAAPGVNNTCGVNQSFQEEFFSSVRNGNQQEVERLLANGAEINFLSEEGTALHIAVQKANEAMVECLLNHQADPNIQKPVEYCEYVDEYGESLCPVSGNLYLAEYGGETPLWEAVTRRLATIAKSLLINGADPTISPTYQSETLSKIAVVVEAVEKELITLTESILNSYGSYEFTTENATKLLQTAILSGNKKGVELILNRFEYFYLPMELDFSLSLEQEKLIEVRRILQKCEPRGSFEGFLNAFHLGKSGEAEEYLREIKDIRRINPALKSVFESMDIFVSENEIPDTFLETLKRVINNPDSNGAMLLNHAAGESNYELCVTLLRYGANLHKAIEFAENEAEPSNEVITFLKDLFGKCTKGCLS